MGAADIYGRPHGVEPPKGILGAMARNNEGRMYESTIVAHLGVFGPESDTVSHNLRALKAAGLVVHHDPPDGDTREYHSTWSLAVTDLDLGAVFAEREEQEAEMLRQRREDFRRTPVGKFLGLFRSSDTEQAPSG